MSGRFSLAESLALFGLNLLDAFRHRQFFGHRTSNFPDGLPHLRVDFTMRPVRLVFPDPDHLGDINEMILDAVATHTGAGSGSLPRYASPIIIL